MKELAMRLGVGVLIGVTWKVVQNWNFGRQPVQVYVTADDEETPLLKPVGFLAEWAVLYSDGSLDMVDIEEDGEEWLSQ